MPFKVIVTFIGFNSLIASATDTTFFMLSTAG